MLWHGTGSVLAGKSGKEATTREPIREQLPSLGVKDHQTQGRRMKKSIELLDDEDRIVFQRGLMLILQFSLRL